MNCFEKRVKEFVEDLYKEQCGLTDTEVATMAKRAVYNEQLNYDFEKAMAKYIDEFLWDIGKSDKNFDAHIEKVKDGYQKWLILNNKPHGFKSVSAYLDSIEAKDADRFLIHSILRGRDKGKLRNERLGINNE